MVVEVDAVAVMRRYFDGINAGDIEAAAAVTGPGYVHHSGAGDLDLDAARSGFAFYKTAFPDFRYDVADVFPVDGGAAAVARWTMRGTQDGSFFGSAPTHRSIASPGLSLHRVVDGLIVEEWEYNDDLAIFRELGFRIEPPAEGGDGSSG